MKLQPERHVRRSPVVRQMSVRHAARSSNVACVGRYVRRESTCGAARLHGKLGALSVHVSSPTDPSGTRSMSERASASEHQFRLLRVEVADRLKPHATALAARWESQAKSVALLQQPSDRSAPQHSAASEAAIGLVESLINALTVDDEESEEAISSGFRFGSDSFDRGVSLHHTMKALDLLSSMTLYAVESELDAREDLSRGRASDGLRLARHLQRRAALMTLAATRGYTQAYSEALRQRFRHLRHDLRNPLGTITSVLALMDDESVPLEARVNPSFRAMAKRNARTLEQMIADQLSDAAALLPVVAGQDVSLRTVACGVRRELREEAERRGVSVLVGAVSPRGQLDASGLELVLHGALLAAIQECAEGEQLHIEFGDSSKDRAVIILSCESGRPPISDGAVLERLRALADRIGASVDAGEQLTLSVTMQTRTRPTTDDGDRPRSIARDPVGLVDGESLHDLRSAREGHHR